MQAVSEEEQGLDAALDEEDRLATEATHAHEEHCSALKAEQEELEKKLSGAKKSWLIKRRWKIVDYGEKYIKAAMEKEQKYLRVSKSKQDGTH